MSQHGTYNIPDQSGTSFRLDVNDYFQSILSNNSGETEPANPVAGMLWYDTLNHIIKVRNSTNSAWTELASSVTGEVNSVATTATSNTVGGLEASVAKLPNTIIKRNGAGQMETDIVGNAPLGDVQSIGGYSAAQLQDMTNVVGRNYLSITAGDKMFQAGAVGWGLNSYIKFPFPVTSVRVYLWVRQNQPYNSGISVGDPAPRFIVYHNSTTPTFNKAGASFTAAPYTRHVGNVTTNLVCYEFDLVTASSNPIIVMEALDGSSNYSVGFAFGSSQFGIQPVLSGANNLGNANNYRQVGTLTLV